MSLPGKDGTAAPKAEVRHIAFLAFDGVVPLDLVGPLQIFQTASSMRARDGAGEAYSISVASARGGEIVAAGGLRFLTTPVDTLTGVDTVIVPGGQDGMEICSLQISGWLAANASRVRRVCSVCVGAFALASAGLLRNRRATTHWASCDRLARDFPETRVENDQLFVSDGPVWTSAGVSAGIDLAVHLVAEDLGQEIAYRVSKALVLAARRPGHASQSSAALDLQYASGEQFGKLTGWMIENMAADLSVDTLARRCAMSPRTFARKFHAATGMTPGSAVKALRVDAARQYLHARRRPLKAIAAACGFRNEQHMRRAFIRLLGVPPTCLRDGKSGA